MMVSWSGNRKRNAILRDYAKIEVEKNEEVQVHEEDNTLVG